MRYEVGDIIIDAPIRISEAWVFENEKWTFRELTSEELGEIEKLGRAKDEPTNR